jgi:hypothetical protein
LLVNRGAVDGVFDASKNMPVFKGLFFVDRPSGGAGSLAGIDSRDGPGWSTIEEETL